MALVSEGSFKHSWWLAAGLGLGVVLLWALFEFVVADAELLLGYLRALLWPAVVLITVLTFRDPIQRKFAQLLRVEGLGGAVEFGPQQLEDDLRLDVEQLTASAGSGDDQAETEGGEQVSPRVSPVDVATRLHHRVAPESDSDGGGATPPLGDEVSAEERLLLHRELSDQHREDLVELAVAAGGPQQDQAWLNKLVSEPQAGRRLLMKRLRTTLRSADRRVATTRDSIESIVQKSAAWGYDVGASGSEPLVPDIQWSEDGSWHITTAVPKARQVAGPTPSEAKRSFNRHREHVSRLEREIIDMEKQANSPMNGLSFRMANEPYLHELKRRLDAMDPGNPFSFNR